jgi:hypothetical protein
MLLEQIIETAKKRVRNEKGYENANVGKADDPPKSADIILVQAGS